MVSTKTLLLGLCVALSVACATAASDCTFTVDFDGLAKTYHLAALTHAVGDREHLYGNATDGSRVYVNLCAPTTVVCPANTSVCMLTPDYHYVSRGATDSITVAPLACKDCRPNHGVTATFKSTEKCSPNTTVCSHPSLASPPPLLRL